ncbi:hypothetical protein WAB17_01725 [Parerythrobacter aurantius]|uniref:hypothetical protein n=1 Tax=Parerythrobacter aurantius TaxID=3127706 RepID=UPI0032455C90
MTMAGSRLRQIGWAMALSLAFLLFAALSFRVNAVKSDVIRAEREIVDLTLETKRLEIEFETRANQQQLANWNAVDFGYIAPRADQYLENERQLASLSQPVMPNAPSPIRVARTDVAAELPAMVSPLTGRPAASGDESADRPDTAVPDRKPRTAATSPERASLAERLGMAAEIDGAAAMSARIGE